MGFNPRYAAYAKAHGNTPEAQLAHDERLYPGAKMMPYMQWIQDRWRAWDIARGHQRDHVRDNEEHRAFDVALTAYVDGGCTGAM